VLASGTAPLILYPVLDGILCAVLWGIGSAALYSLPVSLDVEVCTITALIPEILASVLFTCIL